MINNSMKNYQNLILIVDNMIVVCYIHMIVLNVKILIKKNLLILQPYRTVYVKTPFIKKLNNQKLFKI